MLFIAEIGMNHNGNFDLAYELIRQAKFAGADIAKFQCGWRDKEGELNPINLEVLKKLVKWCEYFEIEFMSSVITPEAYEMVKQVKPRRFKIASRTLAQNIELTTKVVEESSEVLISTGMWDASKKLPFLDNKKVSYLWCRSFYPTQPWDLLDLPKDFKSGPYKGYSDHSIGIETCLLAITRGAKIIEKHFTLDKSSNVIRDHALSATPDEFLQLTRIGRDLEKKIKIGV